MRKSERERQAIEPNTVTDRIIVHQQPQYQNSTKLIAALIAINLAILVYFLGFAQKTPPVATQPVASVVEHAPPARAEIAAPPLPVAKPFAPKTPPIAKIVEPKVAAPATPSPAKSVSVPKQSVEFVKPAPVKPKQLVQPATPLPHVTPEIVKKQLIEPVKPELLQPVVPQVEPATDVIEKPAPVPIKSDLPFLDELPADFRRSLPDLPINVFSYSSTPSERFVMIGMVKYVPGQNIKDVLELKEIRPDSIVVSYEGRTFKIKRP
ncbi:MAG: general secretion pathway protein GspB [Methylococcaceae bacterium]|nr:general secretion pathway protein GspB [Methylococcaceae bacterium]